MENKLHKINDCNSYYKIKAATSRLLVKQLYPKKFNFQNISDIYTYSDELYFYLWIFFWMRTVIKICDFFKGWWSVLKFYLPTKPNQRWESNGDPPIRPKSILTGELCRRSCWASDRTSFTSLLRWSSLTYWLCMLTSYNSWQKTFRQLWLGRLEI